MVLTWLMKPVIVPVVNWRVVVTQAVLEGTKLILLSLEKPVPETKQ